ncbi:hypothetical protein HDU92_004943 [Lobulomyces angularis]|nr:hypothetical protein HDU92_004943 [Lobulomyces angularis]
MKNNADIRGKNSVYVNRLPLEETVLREKELIINGVPRELSCCKLTNSWIYYHPDSIKKIKLNLNTTKIVVNGKAKKQDFNFLQKEPVLLDENNIDEASKELPLSQYYNHDLKRKNLHSLNEFNNEKSKIVESISYSVESVNQSEIETEIDDTDNFIFKDTHIIVSTLRPVLLDSDPSASSKDEVGVIKNTTIAGFAHQTSESDTVNKLKNSNTLSLNTTVMSISSSSDDNNDSDAVESPDLVDLDNNFNFNEVLTTSNCEIPSAINCKLLAENRVDEENYINNSTNNKEDIKKAQPCNVSNEEALDGFKVKQLELYEVIENIQLENFSKTSNAATSENINSTSTLINTENDQNSPIGSTTAENIESNEKIQQSPKASSPSASFHTSPITSITAINNSTSIKLPLFTNSGDSQSQQNDNLNEIENFLTDDLDISKYY